MVVFGKQDPNEVSSSTSRSLLVPIDERMACNPDLSVSTVTKLTESVPPYFFSRHEATASFLSNTTATMVRQSVRARGTHLFYSIENIGNEKAAQVIHVNQHVTVASKVI